MLKLVSEKISSIVYLSSKYKQRIAMLSAEAPNNGMYCFLAHVKKSGSVILLISIGKYQSTHAPTAEMYI